MLSQFTAQGKCLRTCMENIHNNFSKVTERKKRGKQGRPLVESSFLTRDQALSLSSESTDSKTLDYQRTNPREYQIVRTHTKETTGTQDPASPNHHHHPVQDTSSKQQTEQKYKPSHQQTGLPPHSALPRGKTSKKAAQTSPYTELTQTTGPT